MNEIHKRKSYSTIGKIYFWTATIHKWQHVLSSEFSKQIIINYLKKLSDEGLVTIYAFVLMPNHIHLIWQQNKLNGKEAAFSSFLKYTAHVLLRQLKKNGLGDSFKVNASNKAYEFWQRDSMAIEIYSRRVAQQKIDYIHTNPICGKWKLATDDVDYNYSSAKFYHSGVDDFGFLNDMFAYFDGT